MQICRKEIIQSSFVDAIENKEEDNVEKKEELLEEVEPAKNNSEEIAGEQSLLTDTDGVPI